MKYKLLEHQNCTSLLSYASYHLFSTLRTFVDVHLYISHLNLDNIQAHVQPISNANNFQQNLMSFRQYVNFRRWNLQHSQLFVTW